MMSDNNYCSTFDDELFIIVMSDDLLWLVTEKSVSSQKGFRKVSQNQSKLLKLTFLPTSRIKLSEKSVSNQKGFVHYVAELCTAIGSCTLVP